jgi:xanthine dehydrogenase accessory factor
LTPATLSALNQARAERRAIAYARKLPDGAESLLPSPQAPALLNAAALAALAANKSCTQNIAGELWFIEARNPSPRLIIVGAVHIAQALAPLAAMMGFDVALADPRQALIGKDRFPNTRMLNAWTDTAMDELQPDSGTAVVVLTHDPKLDDPALDRALRSEAFYIGALGSRKSHLARRARLASLGHDGEALARIRGPVGLRIAALTAPEIALSIIAEIVAVRRGGDLARRGEP